MQIREQGRLVQLIRSPYDPARKRCVQKVVHTFPQHAKIGSASPEGVLSADQLADLSADEIKTLSDWLRAQSDKRAADDRQFDIRYASFRLSRLADAIKADGVDDGQAAAIWAGLELVGKALKAGGHRRPRREVVEATRSTHEAQTALPLASQ